jgi:hypothetical protein
MESDKDCFQADEEKTVIKALAGKTNKKSVALVMLMALVSFVVLAADGDLDTSFGTNGATNVSFPNSTSDALGVARQQADSSFLVAGIDNVSNGNSSVIYIATLSSNGTVVGTPVTTSLPNLMAGGINGVSVPTDGKVFVLGQGLNTSGVFAAVARLNPDGTQDASYSRPNGVGNESGGGQNVIVEATTNVSSSIIVGARNATSGNKVGVLRLTSSLQADTGFGVNGTALISAYPAGYVSASNDSNGISLLEDANGNYYVVGDGEKNFTTGANPKAQDRVLFVAKFDSVGSPVSSFGGANNGIATLPVSSFNCATNCANVHTSGFALDASGNILVAGQMPNPQNTNQSVGFIARLSAGNGAMDKNFGPGAAGTNSGVVIVNPPGNVSSQPAGILSTASGIYYLTSSNLFRLNNSNGAVDASFNSAATNVGALNNRPNQPTDQSSWYGVVQMDANNALLLGGVGGCVGVNICGNSGTVTSPDQAVVAKVRLVTNTTPNQFAFNPATVTNQALSATVTSNPVTITGINSAAPISVSGGPGSAYSIGCNGTFNSANGTINNGQTVCVRHTASSSPNTTVSTTLNVGPAAAPVSASFSSTTVPADTIPDAFSFNAVTNQPLNSPVTSNTVTITGINTATPISISGGTNPGYSVGCNGTFTSANGTITNNQTVCVQVNSANAPNTSSSTTLNVGGVTGAFQVTTANGPVVSLAPLSLSFNSQSTGTTSSAKSLTLSNTGTAALNIASIVSTTSDYAQTNNCPATLATSTSCTINVTFSPTTTGTRNGAITITSNASTSPDSVNLTGTGTGPQPAVSLAPASLTFSSQNVGTTSAAKTSTLTNTGNATLTITSIIASGDYAQTSDCPTGTPIAINGFCTISVTFRPTAAGTRTGGVTIMSNAPSNPDLLNLSGTGIAPAVSLAPANLTFASQNVGATSAAQPVTLTNSGSAPLSLTSVVASGDYAQTNTCPASLAVSASCTINVTFTPTATGTRTGAITINSNASTSPNAVPLSGTGATPASADLAPASLSFASQNVGSSSAAQPLTLTNSGTLTLSITSIAASSDYSQTNNCGASLAGGSSCTINVSFVPTANGTRTGSVTVVSNAASSPNTVGLTGTGTTPPTATLSPTSLTFANQNVGTSSTAQPVALTNGGTLPLSIASIVGSGDYAQTNNCGPSLGAGASCTINVTFTPTASGTRAGSVTVTSNAATSPNSVNASGTGVAPAVTLSATSLSFPTQNVGTTSAAMTSTLTNSGTAPLTITSIVPGGDYAQTNNCGPSLAAGASCTISVTFTPTVSGTRTGSVTINSNAASSPNLVTLSGAAVSSATVNTPAGTVTLTADQGQITSFTNTATVPAGAPAGYTFPLGFFNYTVTGLPTTGAPATVTFTFTLPAGTSADSYVKCSGTTCAPFAGATVSGNTLTLTITDNGPGDSNAAQGTIVDPGAPAVTVAQKKDYGGGAMGWLTLLLMGIPALFRLRKRA